MHKHRNSSAPSQQDNDVEMTRVDNEEGPDGEENSSDKSEVWREGDRRRGIRIRAVMEGMNVNEEVVEMMTVLQEVLDFKY